MKALRVLHRFICHVLVIPYRGYSVDFPEKSE